MTAARRTRADEISIREWAAELEAAASIARQLAPTDFLPLTLKRWHRDDKGRLLDGKDGRPPELDIDATTATAAAAIMTGAAGAEAQRRAPLNRRDQQHARAVRADAARDPPERRARHMGLARFQLGPRDRPRPPPRIR